MLKETLKRNKGITLIALVVTIIVLLILAGVSINMLTGENGILNRASEAKQNTGTAQTEELVKLSVTDALTQGLGSLTDANLKTALNNNIGVGKYEISGDETNGWTVKVNGKEFKIDSPGKIGGTTPGEDTGALPTGEGTTPYLPNGTFSKKEGDLATGLVIKDSNDNEYVWVEVPTTIYSDSKYNTNGTPSSADDWEKIRDCLKAYTSDYSNSDYKDTNTDGTTYSDDYKNMLKSVYTNGGFWIGRYEAGLEEGKNPRTSYVAIADSDKAVIKPNMYPYNYVRCGEAQTLAERMNYDGVTSSLIYGVQWDLVLKYIETKEPDQKTNLTSNSITIGNYYNSSFELKRGKFAQYNALSNWFDYNSEEKPTLVTGSQKKEQSSYENGILLTTGATDATNLQNIYDIAGNVFEWTLEFYTTSNPCVYRGCSYRSNGSGYPAKYRDYDNACVYDDDLGFRVGLWK